MRGVVVTFLIVGLLATVAGMVERANLQDVVRTQPAIVAMPQVINAWLIAGFGFVAAAMAAAALAIAEAVDGLVEEQKRATAKVDALAELARKAAMPAGAAPRTEATAAAPHPTAPLPVTRRLCPHCNVTAIVSGEVCTYCGWDYVARQVRPR